MIGMVANKSNFSIEEWDLFRKVPMLTGIIVMAAAPSGPLGVFKESAAAAEMLREGLASAQTELMQVLAEDLKTNLSVHKLESESPDQIRAAGLAALRELGNILRAKASEEETAEFKSWLIALARRVAEASHEGGFLGFGGVQVSEAEVSALDQIEIALR
ncbi:MAG: hypothetical protein FJW36_07860 [Acidobacteria bacterium]|nr:hypothetical protein [Acidobacteriota bacterium]